jgi:hypothetical protein
MGISSLLTLLYVPISCLKIADLGENSQDKDVGLGRLLPHEKQNGPNVAANPLLRLRIAVWRVQVSSTCCATPHNSHWISMK